MTPRPLFTVCIPAYNRVRLLPQLLDSILAQDFQDFDILVVEDVSPERAQIAGVISRYDEQHRGRIRYVENLVNLGYDGNLRKLVELAEGRFCVFMGNDDLLCPGALASIAAAIGRHPECGVVVRSYASFEDDAQHPKQVFRYYPDEHAVAAGSQAISAAFRRSVVISGMVIRRDDAARLATDRFDGTLLYQLYLVGHVLTRCSVVFVPQVIALRRDGVPPDFGNSASERGRFVPRDQTPASSLHFMRGMLDIARQVEVATGIAVFDAIRADIGYYSYPILAIQAERPLPVFVRYGFELARLGFWRYALFHLYFLALLLVGRRRTDVVIAWLKRRIGHTPRFGAAHTGRS